MELKKPVMEVIHFEAIDLVASSSCGNDCQNQGCETVCVGNTCTNAVTCNNGYFFID